MTNAASFVPVLSSSLSFGNLRYLSTFTSTRAEFVKQNGSYAENGDGEFAAGYLAGFLKDILDDASPKTWAPHHASHNKQILDFLKGDLTGMQEDTLWRRAKLYNTFAKLQE